MVTKHHLGNLEILNKAITYQNIPATRRWDIEEEEEYKSYPSTAQRLDIAKNKKIGLWIKF